MVHDWEYERRSAEADAFEAYCAEYGWDADDPQAQVWYDAYVARQREDALDAQIAAYEDARA